MPRINKGAETIPFYLTKKVSEMAAEEPGVVNLSRGQAGFLPSQRIYDEAKRIIDREDKGLFRYEKSAGAKDLRQSIADWYGRIFNLDVDPRYVAVTVGGTGAISMALQTFSNYGDQIVIPDPSYPFYMLSANHGLEGRDITRLNIGKEKVDCKKLENVLKKNMQMIVLTSPHNPTGIVYDAGTLKGIMELAKEKDFFVFYDENHFPEVYDGARHLPIQLFDEGRTHSIMLGSLARLAIQGERIGWAVLPQISKDIASTYAAQSPFACTRAQKLAKFVLDNYETLEFKKNFEDYKEKRNMLIPEINKIDGFICSMPEGTSYAFPNIAKFAEKNFEKLEKIVTEESEKRNVSKENLQISLKHNSILVSKFLLYKAGIGVVPGIAYGPASDDYVRFTFSVSREEVEEAIKRLGKVKELINAEKF